MTKQVIMFENGGTILIKKSSGKVYIQVDGLFPILEMWNVGIPGVIGPNIEFDTKRLVETEKQDSLLSAYNKV